MTRTLRLLDVILVALLALLGWQLRREWIGAHFRQQALSALRIRSAAVPGLTPLPSVVPPLAASYADVAAKNLFSRDRNPNVIIDPPAPSPEKPVPPFPIAHGVMLWPGVPPTVVLSEKAGAPQKGYHPDEKIGDWKIDFIDLKYVVLEWNGKQFKKPMEELVEKTPVAAVAAPVAAAPQQSSGLGPPASESVASAMAATAAAAPAQPAAQSLSSSDQPVGPGVDVGGGFRACAPGDPSPSGAVVGGLRKVMAPTPFGTTCMWTPVK